MGWRRRVLYAAMTASTYASGVGATTKRVDSLRIRPTPMHGGLLRLHAAPGRPAIMPQEPYMPTPRVDTFVSSNRCSHLCYGRDGRNSISQSTCTRHDLPRNRLRCTRATPGCASLSSQTFFFRKKINGARSQIDGSLHHDHARVGSKSGCVCVPEDDK